MVSTKTLLLKHHYRLQGYRAIGYRYVQWHSTFQVSQCIALCPLPPPANPNSWRQRSCTPPASKGNIATDTLILSPAPVVYNTSGPMGGGVLYTGPAAENSAVNLSKKISTRVLRYRGISHLYYSWAPADLCLPCDVC